MTRENDKENLTWLVSAIYQITDRREAETATKEANSIVGKAVMLAPGYFLPAMRPQTKNELSKLLSENDPLVLKWISLLYGASGGNLNLGPRFEKEVISELNRHNDKNVAEYSVWALNKGEGTNFGDLQIPPQDWHKQPPNVRRWLYRLITKDRDSIDSNWDFIESLPKTESSAEALEGLAIGLAKYSPDTLLKRFLINWYNTNPPRIVKLQLLWHFAQFAFQENEYREILALETEEPSDMFVSGVARSINQTLEKTRASGSVIMLSEPSSVQVVDKSLIPRGDSESLGAAHSSGQDYFDDGSMKIAKEPSVSRKDAKPYIILSLSCGLLAIGLVSVMLRNMDKLEQSGTLGGFYYFVLISFGLLVAGLLFGVLRSYARYSGQQFNGKLELGGPIVGFTLVLVGGYIFSNVYHESFSVTVFVHGNAGIHDLVLRDSGTILMRLGSETREEHINGKGDVDFKQIPGTFLNQEVHMWVNDERFQAVDPEKMYKLDGNPLNVEVKRKPIHFQGFVRDQSGKRIRKAVILCGQARLGAVDSLGFFDVTVSVAENENEVRVTIVATGFYLWQKNLSTNALNEVIMLRRINRRPR
ncbi:MAG TPA: hypothetical protein VLX91_00745 [Candidatus Acidoferrales bacterium]|nr:hypothetical protein [Candidatus Acidoferrales bacterium]